MQTINLPNRKIGENDLGNAGATFTVDFTAGAYDQKKITLTADSTLTLTANAKSMYVLSVVGAGFTIVWPASVLWQGLEKQPSADGTTVFVFFYDGTNFIEIKE